jgi:hypothetical protein
MPDEKQEQKINDLIKIFKKHKQMGLSTISAEHLLNCIKDLTAEEKTQILKAIK